MSRADSGKPPADTGAGWWLKQVLSWALLLVVVALLAAMLVVPRLSGSTAYTVLTGSMSPTMPPGTLAVVKPVDPAGLSIGDAITYQLHSGEPEVVTHRIISVVRSLGGDTTFVTQGDANPVPDASPVKAGQIRGVVWYSIPYMGYVNGWLTGEQRIYAVGAAVVLLLGYTAFMFTGAALDSRRARRRQTGAAPGQTQSSSDERDQHGTA